LKGLPFLPLYRKFCLFFFNHEGKNHIYLAAQLEKSQKLLKFPYYENCEVLS